MTDRQVIRGDSFTTRRAFYQITLRDDQNQLFDLTGCTVRTTFKSTPDAPADDPDDTMAAIRHTLIVGVDGVPTLSNGLYLVGPATGGTIEERLTVAESIVLPLSIKLVSDIEVTDAGGEVMTLLFQGTLTAIDGITNRTVG